jgi:hypothetical protein
VDQLLGDERLADVQPEVLWRNKFRDGALGASTVREGQDLLRIQAPGSRKLIPSGLGHLRRVDRCPIHVEEYCRCHCGRVHVLFFSVWGLAIMNVLLDAVSAVTYKYETPFQS